MGGPECLLWIWSQQCAGGGRVHQAGVKISADIKDKGQYSQRRTDLPHGCGKSMEANAENVPASYIFRLFCINTNALSAIHEILIGTPGYSVLYLNSGV